MTQGVKNLIDAIASGDSLAIDAAFNSEMANRISERLDDMRAEVAQNMFATESVQVDEEAEFDLEGYSVEEVEEFMQTEDFEQLDELSKKTLVSYVDKAQSASHASRQSAKSDDKHISDLNNVSTLWTGKNEIDNPLRKSVADASKHLKGTRDKSLAKSDKRDSGVRTAMNKLAK
jgi:hypothetical protein